ncbi:MAG TPA: aldo/keto reductase [Alphaproteobacteria bacterium]|nr:aldo/keto reductase [Alphaproteobacteria bacterium]
MKSVEIKGRQVPVLGLGTWELKGSVCQDVVGKALELGYRHIDTAQIYDNESDVGTAIKSSGISRTDIFLTTKVWMDSVASSALPKSVEESLKKLKTDYVDLLLLHWPVSGIPLRDQISALETVQDWGLAKMIGVSNYPTALMRRIIEETEAEIVTDQVEYHPYLSQSAVLDFCRQHDMFLTAYSPLARGKVRTDMTLLEIAGKYGKSAGQVALRWLVQQESVVAIPKTENLLHLNTNLEIFDFELSPEEMAKISALAQPNGRIVAPDWSPKWDRDDQEKAA